MVGAEDDVPDALYDVGAHDAGPGLIGGDLDPGLRRMGKGGPTSAVEQFDFHYSIGNGGLQAREFDAFTGETFGSGIDPAAFDEGIRQFFDFGRFRVLPGRPGSTRTTGSRMPASTGVRHKTLNWPGAVSLISR